LLRVVRSFWLVTFLILAAVPAALHAQVVGGSINGIVTDSTGAKISGANVIVVNVETGTERKLVTDSDGRYSAPSITVGTYNITGSSSGFGKQEKRGVTITVGLSTQVDLVLSVVAVA
jgi:Carboxypeptidase regulatory-like domain